MSGEDNANTNPGGSLAAEAAKSVSNVALEVYKDAAQPATRQLGEGLGKLAKIVVLPITMIAAGTDWLRGLLTRTQRQLAGVPPFRQLTSPSTTVTGQVLLNYGLLGDDERAENELRDMYASLLASAIDTETAQTTHPAFASMIAQMTVHEARIIRSMAFDPTHIWPAIELRERPDKGPSYITQGKLYGVPEIPFDLREGERCIENLERLNLVMVEFKKAIFPGDCYSEIETKIETMTKMLKSSHQDSTFETMRGIIKLTSLGMQFARVCVRDVQYHDRERRQSRHSTTARQRTASQQPQQPQKK